MPVPAGYWIAVVTLIGAILTVLLIRHRRHRIRTLAALADERRDLVKQHPITIAARDEPHELAHAFARDPIVRVDGFLPTQTLQSLTSEAESNIPRMKRTYIPTHKKGKTLSYENIHRYAHGCLGFYHSPEVQQWVSTVVGLPVHPTPDQDQSSLSVLCYNEPGDHIHWHYDHNFYRGRHFTVLLSLANQSAAGGLSQSTLVRKLPRGEDQVLDTSANTLVIFEGTRVLHRALPTAEGDLRLMLSMTYCSDPRIHWFKELARRVKDTAFYGIRALWD